MVVFAPPWERMVQASPAIQEMARAARWGKMTYKGLIMLMMNIHLNTSFDNFELATLVTEPPTHARNNYTHILSESRQDINMTDEEAVERALIQ